MASSNRPRRSLLRRVRGRSQSSLQLAVEGLEQRVVLSAAQVGAVPGVVPFEVKGADGVFHPFATAGPVGYTPRQLEAVYGLNQVSFAGIKGNGAGQTIAVVDAYDNPSFVDSTDPNFATSSLHQFDLQFGLPDPPSFLKVNQFGQTDAPPAPSTVWGPEIAIDVEWAHAMAPAANIVLVEATTNSLADLTLTAAAEAAKLANVVSMSYGSTEGSYELPQDSVFDVPGVTFLASTGDDGAPGGYPAYSPTVIAVGGTSLYNLDANGDYPGTGPKGEVGWSLGSDSYAPNIASGGGISKLEPEPGYQLGVQSTGRRTIPDISADADPSTGVPIYDSYDTGTATPWSQYGGTSLASPLMAGMFAIVDQGRALNNLPDLDSRSALTALYNLSASNSADFHDIVNGYNGFNAGPGYDLVTGLGTPNGSLLVPDLAKAPLTAKPVVTAIAVTPTAPKVGVGLAEQFTATASYSDGTKLDVTSSVTWASATPAVATIDANGLATTKAVGSTVITASLAGITSNNDTLTVLPVVSIAVTPNHPYVALLTSQQFVATGTFSDGSTGNITNLVTWASATPAVAAISPTGLATAQTLGTTVITAALAGVTSPGDLLTTITPSFVVNTTQDDNTVAGKTSLRAAILAANAYPGRSISFDPRVFGTHQTITLTGGPIELAQTKGTEAIIAPPAGLTVSGGGASGVFLIDPDVSATFANLTISGGLARDGAGVDNQGGSVLLVNCTISGNVATYQGGGLFSTGSGTTTLDGSTISGNTAQTGSGGGAYITGGSATLADCTISGNTTLISASNGTGGYGGGGIGAAYGDLTMTGCTITNNAANYGNGGGFYSFGGWTTLADCTITGNTASYGGGGVFAHGEGTLVNCSLTGNTASNFGGGMQTYQSDLTVVGGTISGNTSGTTGGGLDIFGGSLTMSGTLLQGNDSSTSGGGLSITNDGSATLVDSILSGNTASNYGGGVYINGGSLTMASSAATGNSTYIGGGVYNDTGTATLTDCTISGNTTTGFGGGIRNVKGTMTLDGDRIENNTSVAGNGGGINNNGTLTVDDSVIADNQAGGSGGGLRLVADSSTSPNVVTIRDSIISGNTSAKSGGGINALFTDLTMTGTAVGDNTVTSSGGGIYIYDSSATLADCTISGNTAAFVGGGVAAIYSDLALTGGTIGNNTANYGNGGGVYAYGSTATLAGCTISGNTTLGGPNGAANYGGGGIATNASTLTLTGCLLTGNADADGNGGALLSYSSTTTLTDCTISGNTAAYGGGVQSMYGAVTLVDDSISNNAATQFGGGAQLIDTTVAISGTTFRENSAPTGGGGMEIVGGPTATLTDCTITGNTSAGFGGGIADGVTLLSMTSCSVTNNSGYAGGGVYNGYATAALTDCTITGNIATGFGGGIRNNVSSVMTLDGCLVEGNTSVGSNGGGINNVSTLTIANSTIANNTAGGSGGGIRSVTSDAALTVTNSTISGNTSATAGGGLNIEGSTATLTGSTISGNSAPNGAGLYITGGTATLAGDTIAGNTATAQGGGLMSVSSTTALTNVTVSANATTSGQSGSGGGLFLTGTASLVNTIVAGNTSAGGASDIGGTATATGTNDLIGTGGSGGLVNGVAGNLVGVANPGLAPLGDYGGLTRTMPLLPGSLAIDAGTSGAGAPTTDQRGLGRVGAVDIGAFESQGFTFTLVPGSSPQTTAVGTAFGNPLAVRVSANNSVEPVNGGVVTFTSPVGGASATLSAASAVIANGQASVAATANGVAGSYTVAVTTTGVPAPSRFSLTNAAVTTITGISAGWGTAGSAALVTAADGLRLLAAGRNTDLPWYGLQRFTFTMSGSTALTAANVSLTGINLANYAFTLGGSGSTYTITLLQPITLADRITLTIGGTGVASFTRRLDVLPGDVNDDGVVNSQDTVLTRNAYLGSGAVLIPLVFLDVNGDGTVDVNDYNLVRQRAGTRLP